MKLTAQEDPEWYDKYPQNPSGGRFLNPSWPQVLPENMFCSRLPAITMTFYTMIITGVDALVLLVTSAIVRVDIKASSLRQSKPQPPLRSTIL